MADHSTPEVKKKSWFGRHRILTVVGALLLIGVIGSAAGGNKPTASTANSATPATNTSVQSKSTATPAAKQPSVPVEYTSALSKASSYANTMHMSKQGVYDQLVSEYGEKFSAEAAQYAIDNVKADWNANALAKAKDYQNNMHMSPAAIHDQLVSDYGEKFTQSEADYAIQHLNG